MSIAIPPVQSLARPPQVLPDSLGVTTRLAVGIWANNAAAQLNHNYIGTEHALLGLLADIAGIPMRAVVSLGRSTEDVREKVADVIRAPEAGTRQLDHLRVRTENFEVLMRRAVSRALGLGHKEVEPVDVLIEIARFVDCNAYKVIITLGLEPRDLMLAANRIARNPRATSPQTDPLGT